MKCIIIAAGYATRMYPLTENQAKSLLPIKGKAILSYIVEKIGKVQEIDSIYILSNNKFYTNFAWWLSNNKAYFSKPIEIIDEHSTAPENQKGGIFGCLTAINQFNIDDDLLILYGDNLFELDLKNFVDFFIEKKSTCLACYELPSLEEAKKFGNIEIDSENKITEIKEKPKEPKSNLAITGIYIIKKQDISKLREYYNTLELTKQLSPHSNITFFIQDIYKKQDIFAFPFSGQWADIGTIEDYEKVK